MFPPLLTFLALMMFNMNLLVSKQGLALAMYAEEQ
jgi:hypothetical protein